MTNAELIKTVREIIAEQPTVDAVPVVHGYNKQFEFPSLFTCSVCGWESWDTYCGDTNTYNYCPYCGAKMDGETEHGNTYSLGKIEMPNGAMKQIIADGERKEKR